MRGEAAEETLLLVRCFPFFSADGFFSFALVVSGGFVLVLCTTEGTGDCFFTVGSRSQRGDVVMVAATELEGGGTEEGEEKSALPVARERSAVLSHSHHAVMSVSWRCSEGSMGGRAVPEVVGTHLCWKVEVGFPLPPGMGVGTAMPHPFRISPKKPNRNNRLAIRERSDDREEASSDAASDTFRLAVVPVPSPPVPPPPLRFGGGDGETVVIQGKPATRLGDGEEHSTCFPSPSSLVRFR